MGMTCDPDLQRVLTVWCNWTLRNGNPKVWPEELDPPRGEQPGLTEPWSVQRVNRALEARRLPRSSTNALEGLLLHVYGHGLPVQTYEILGAGELWPSNVTGLGFDPLLIKQVAIKAFLKALKVEVAAHPKPKEGYDPDGEWA